MKIIGNSGIIVKIKSIIGSGLSIRRANRVLGAMIICCTSCVYCIAVWFALIYCRTVTCKLLKNTKETYRATKLIPSFKKYTYI